MNSLKRVYQWFHKLPKQIQDSIFFSVSVVGFFSTIFTVLGASLKDLSDNLWIRIGIIILSTIILAFGYYIVVGNVYKDSVATVYKGNIIKNLIMDCQSYTKYRPNETTGGIFVSWRRKEELPTGA